MKILLWALALFGIVVTAVVGTVAFFAVQPAEPAPAQAPVAIVDPFKQPAAPARADIVDPFKAPAAGCPAGFVDQGGVCVGQASVDYQADAQRRADNRELAKAIADELRDD